MSAQRNEGSAPRTLLDDEPAQPEFEDDPDDWEVLEPDDEELTSDRVLDEPFDDEDTADDWRDEPFVEPEEWDLASLAALCAPATGQMLLAVSWRQKNDFAGHGR